mmetsp:Transcript_7960/g.20301  ORF Transcript_7960/g.20301 Transcript_7960/m.20301 type:complete len:274 (-) Transcript_7960:136-957(-)
MRAGGDHRHRRLPSHRQRHEPHERYERQQQERLRQWERRGGQGRRRLRRGVGRRLLLDDARGKQDHDVDKDDICTNAFEHHHRAIVVAVVRIGGRGGGGGAGPPPPPSAADADDGDHDGAVVVLEGIGADVVFVDVVVLFAPCVVQEEPPPDPSSQPPAPLAPTPLPLPQPLLLLPFVPFVRFVPLPMGGQAPMTMISSGSHLSQKIPPLAPMPMRLAARTRISTQQPHIHICTKHRFDLSASSARCIALSVFLICSSIFSKCRCSFSRLIRV